MIFVVYTKEKTNIMKKTKILVPALGLLLLSTTASISGTVAWFTANRVYEMTAGEFAVVSTTHNLDVKLHGGVGTQVGDPTVIEVKDDYVLTDGSYDHTTKRIVAPDVSGTKIGKVTELSNASESTLMRDTNVYTAFTWEMDFSLEFGAVSQTTGLFFNAEDSEITAGTNGGTTIVDTARGFRMAFVPTALGSNAFNAEKAYVIGDFVTYSSQVYKCTTAHAAGAWNADHFTLLSSTNDVDAYAAGVSRVWADLQGGADDSTGKWCTPEYVSVDHAAPVFSDSATYAVNDLVEYNGNVYKCTTAHTTAAWDASHFAVVSLSGTSYSGHYLMDKDYDTAVPADSAIAAASAANEENYLGTFTFTANKTVHLNYTVIVWFEGTDINITSDADTVYEIVQSELHFGSANLA